MKYDLCIIGGAGHVGLPLGIAFANKRVKTALFDINQEWLTKIQSGLMPFREKNGEAELKKALQKGYLITTASPHSISQSRAVLLVIGTPVDEYLNPDFNGLMRVVEKYLSYFRNGQILILRSTVFPGTSERLQKYFQERRKKIGIAFCPERIAQGKSLEELGKLPQIISAFDEKTLSYVRGLFRKITPRSVIAVRPVEAELAKLFSNAWRYIKFAVGNHFFMIAEDHDLNYRNIYKAMCEDYPRNKDLPSPGFAAGPCLFKDTMQLAAFNNNNFFLGHAAMLVNEGLPNYILQRLKKRFWNHTLPASFLKPIVAASARFSPQDLMEKIRSSHDLKNKTIGILGMAFKAGSDDKRDSLSYKLRNIAQAECQKVLCHDVYIKDSSFSPLDTVIKNSDIVILAAPHKEYRKIDPRKYPQKQFIDIWNFWV